MDRSIKIATTVTAVLLATLALVGAAFSASVATQVLKGAAIGLAVTKAAEPLDKFINTVTIQRGMKSNLDTKVVPILSVGEKGYIGGAQVSGPKSEISKVKAVFEYEKNFSNNNYRAKALLPSASLNPLKLERVPKVGVTAIIDVALDGRVKHWTTGTGIQTGDVIRGGAVLVAVKNFGDTMNKGLNAITFNKGLATKVVPMGSIGEKAYLGGAQVSASANEIGKVNAVWQYEDLFDGGKFRLKILVPTTSSNPLKMQRVQGAGVTAVIDMALSQQKDASASKSDRRDLGTLYRRDDDDRNDKYKERKDQGKHKGWYIGKHKGRKHEWVDEKWQKKLASIEERDREPFVDWLDGRKDRDINKFDQLYKLFLNSRD